MSDQQRSWENFGQRRPMRAASAAPSGRTATPGWLSGMSDTTRRILIIAIGLTGSVLLAATIIWGTSRMGPRTVPLIEADGRPFRVRPEGLPATPPATTPPPGRSEQARLMPAPEAPRPDALRQQMQPPAPASAALPQASQATVAPATAATAGPTRPGAQRPAVGSPAAGAQTPANAAPAAVGSPANAAPRQAQPPAAARPAQPVTAPAGRAAIQLSAAATEEAARSEWERLRRRAPELAGMTPRITRLDREGREPLWRLRVGGLADSAAARTLCEQLRAKGAACNPV